MTITHRERIERIGKISGLDVVPTGLDLTCPVCHAQDGRMCRCHIESMRAAADRLDARAAEPRPTQPSLAGDSATRKQIPMFDGLIGYFPNACAYVSHVSLRANEQHNPGQPMHWAFDKSIGTGNEIIKHLAEQGTTDTDGLLHTGKAAWRALELLERELLASNPALKPGKNVKGFERK